jgi:hypothetical protein
VMYIMVAVFILGAWYQFERNRRDHAILYISMLGMLLLASWLRF